MLEAVINQASGFHTQSVAIARCESDDVCKLMPPNFGINSVLRTVPLLFDNDGRAYLV